MLFDVLLFDFWFLFHLLLSYSFPTIWCCTKLWGSSARCCCCAPLCLSLSLSLFCLSKSVYQYNCRSRILAALWACGACAGGINSSNISVSFTAGPMRACSTNTNISNTNISSCSSNNNSYRQALASSALRRLLAAICAKFVKRMQFANSNWLPRPKQQQQQQQQTPQQ